MPFCPNCHCEYRHGFTRCSDCDVALVELLADDNLVQRDNGALELTELGNFPDPMAAQMFQELLESNGIVSVMQSDFNAGAGTYTASPNALLVSKNDFAKAHELYEEYFEGDQVRAELEEDVDYQEETGGLDDD